MHAADLDYRARTLTGCIPPLLVSRLLELGHEREVEFQAGRGEWFCALEWARLLGHQGQREQALEVLAPYIATNWWPAAQARAELLEGWGRVEEAIALSRPYAEAGDRLALVFFARLLARHDRSGEDSCCCVTGSRTGSSPSVWSTSPKRPTWMRKRRPCWRSG
ncbi:hypothetical protein OHB50_21660 [Streptomyces anulatus]|uniref:hypothetical protein n=1 Tax=Streptomyces sp. wa1071 TaxID=1828217 RepID=UPI00211D8123|nr:MULTISPECIES: hypothetical protein [unclassified Streptomyces]WTE28060.1 hypothetical protein OHB50_21660 [Streptomyces anulatus]